VRDRQEILYRLESLYSEIGRRKDAEATRQKIDILDKREGTLTVSKKGGILQLKKTLDFGEEGIPLDELDRLKIDIHKDWHLQGGGKLKLGEMILVHVAVEKNLKGAAEDKTHQNGVECKII